MNPLRRLFARGGEDSALADEIRAHLEEKADELAARGMPREEALLAARRAFGNVTRVQELGREAWQWPTLESFLMDVRYALRQLRRNPGVSAAAVLTLALGIAANTVVFSWTRAVLVNPLPGAADAARVMAIESRTPDGDWTPTSYLDFQDYREHTRSFASMSVSYPTALAFGDDARSERRFGELVSGTFFDLMGVRPAVGRFFVSAEQDDAAGAHPVAVISHGLWTSRFHADSTVVGSTVRINRYPFTVVGVAPPSFHGSMPGSDIELWLPATMLSRLDPNGGMFLQDRKTRMFRVLARLRDGVTPDRARADLGTLVRRMSELNASTSAGMGAALVPLWQSHYGIQDGLRAPLLVLTGACALVLLIVCANMANLLLARATGRRKELGLRLALGAPRGRLVRQLLTEASVLTLAGAALALIGTVWLSGALRSLVPAFAAPNLVRPRVDGVVILFTAALACGVSLLAGIAPALHGAREQLGEALNEAGRGAAGGRSGRLRGLLVASEMALAVVALVGAGFFLKSFGEVRAVRPGFTADGVAVGQVSLSAAGYDGGRADAYLRAVRERLERVPGVTAVSYADYVPLSFGLGSWEDLEVEGYAPAPSENMKLYRDVVAPGYFAVMRIALLQGRDFTLQDDTAHGPAMIVNEAFVRRFVRGGAALGRRVRGWGQWFTIVGVVQDTKVYRLTEPPTPYFYASMRQVYRPEFPFTFMVRTSGPVTDAVAAIRREAQAADPAMPVFNAMPLAEYIAAPLDVQRTAATLLGILAAVALALAAIGLYGVMAYAVAQRTKEIGIRVALGASRAAVMRLVFGQATALFAAGVAVGLVAALVLIRLVSAALFGVRAGDPAMYAAAAVSMAAIAAVATALPARRALSVDPMIALRHD